ncbi:MAG TPA: cytochrome C, partial [Geobacteraceae bacterium]
AIRKMTSEKIELETGYSLSALAPWVYLKDAWQVRGDFSLPLLKDRKAFEIARANPGYAHRSGVIHR